MFFLLEGCEREDRERGTEKPESSLSDSEGIFFFSKYEKQKPSLYLFSNRHVDLNSKKDENVC